MKEIILSVDLEHDISNPGKYKGTEKAINPLLDILQKERVSADFFALTEIVEKFTPNMKQIVDSGHSVGSHGQMHRMMCNETYDVQLRDLKKSKETIEIKLGIDVTMFRAPNFSVNGDTIKALEIAGYSLDSSVLPGRATKKWKIFPVHYDFRKAPIQPYYPSTENVSKPGKSKILEIPITQNPFAKGQPIGMGYLNLHGVEQTIKAIEAAEGEPIIFLIHPWEMIDIGKHYPSIKDSWKRICSDNLSPLSEMIGMLKNREYTFTKLCTVEKRIRSKI